MGEDRTKLSPAKKYNKSLMENNQIISKDRVYAHGEVYTAEREVKAMVDLVGHEAARIESTFLEPACGDGNFLIEILDRKLNAVFDKYRKSQTECEKYLVVAIGSLYGIDILPDNVERCKKRLFKLFAKKYHQKCKTYYSSNFETVIQFILDKNIVNGDALTMKVPDGSAYIVFSQWSVTIGCNVKRREFLFKELIRVGENAVKNKSGSDQIIEQKTLGIDTNIIERFIEQPVREFPAVHYLRLIDND